MPEASCGALANIPPCCKFPWPVPWEHGQAGVLLCLHVASDGGSDAAQEGDEVDGEYPAEKMDDAPAEVHGLIGRVAHEA